MDTKEEIGKLRKTQEQCNKCKGKGYIVVQLKDKIRFDDCECVLRIRKRLKLLDANIPPRYHSWDLRMLTNQFKQDNPEQYEYIKSYIDNLKDNVDNGVGFWISSPPGLAKSSIISYVLRMAIRLGYKSYFTRASHVISKKFDSLGNPQVRDFLDYLVSSIDVLAIEEIEKVRILGEDSMHDHLFYEFISDIYDSNKVLLLTSNEQRDTTLSKFPNFISDRLSQLDYLSFTGKQSGRRISLS